MEKSTAKEENERAEQAKLEAKKRKLARPAKDKREVTIGPTTGVGPDITVG